MEFKITYKEYRQYLKEVTGQELLPWLVAASVLAFIIILNICFDPKSSIWVILIFCELQVLSIMANIGLLQKQRLIYEFRRGTKDGEAVYKIEPCEDGCFLSNITSGTRFRFAKKDIKKAALMRSCVYVVFLNDSRFCFPRIKEIVDLFGLNKT